MILKFEVNNDGTWRSVYDGVVVDGMTLRYWNGQKYCTETCASNWRFSQETLDNPQFKQLCFEALLKSRQTDGYKSNGVREESSKIALLWV